jgi:hypothetical protein
MNIYQTTHRAACPNGNLMDSYQVTIRSQETIMVKEIYQEDLATLLRAKLGAEVIVVGSHHGIQITSTRA